jgi:L-alanine-DL-glutamate epimerase-like enolase superfamily enzyme
MRITGYRCDSYLMRMDRLIGDANLPEGVDLMPGSVLFLETDANLTGISLGYGGEFPAWMFEAVEGQDPREVLSLWGRLNDLLHKGGNRGTATLFLSLLDMALWDLKAKAAGEPLWRLLGAREGRVPAYASGLDYPLSDEQLFSFYQRMAARGIHAGKLKVGLDPEADLRRLEIMYEALATSGKTPQLMIDANEYWSAKEAVRQIRRLEEKFDLTWVEEPARRWDYDGLRLVSQQVRAAVATGENLQSVADLYPLVSEQAVDVINISTNHSGVTGCRQIAHLAHLYSIPVTMNNAQANYMAHVAAALPNHWMMEVVDPGREHCLRFDNRVEDGCILLGDSPGFGIEVDRAKLEALQRSPPTGHGRFPFPRGEGAGRRVTAPPRGKLPWR